MATEIKKENYILIQGWMVTDLKLKGNDLLVYAIIYGFSQNEDQYFTGSVQYLAEWTNSTRQGIIKTLKGLVERGLIKKEEIGLNKNRYCAVLDSKLSLQSTEFTSKQSLQGESTELTSNSKLSLHNNIYNTIDNILHTEDEGEEVKTKTSKEEIYPLISQILKKYHDLNLPAYEYKPDNYVILEAFNTLGARKLFEALEILSKSEFAMKNMGVNTIFKVDTLKKALNGVYKDFEKKKVEVKPKKDYGAQETEINDDTKALYEALGL